MENQVNRLLDHINNLINVAEIPEEAHIVIQIEDINDIALFNVGEINLNTLIVEFNKWIVIENNNANDDNYFGIFPQANLRYLEPNVYEISFEFYGYDVLMSSVVYKLCTASVKYILNQLLTHQITITDC